MQRVAGWELEVGDDEGERVKLFFATGSCAVVGVLTRAKVRFGPCWAGFEKRRWPQRSRDLRLIRSCKVDPNDVLLDDGGRSQSKVSIILSIGFDLSECADPSEETRLAENLFVKQPHSTSYPLVWSR